MTKKQEEGAASAAPSTEPMMLVRKGRYVGGSGRRFDSVPFGESLVCRTGETYEVRETFKYLWYDHNFASMWEWDGEPHLVPAVNPGQVAPPK
jgi:hypothetical protein